MVATRHLVAAALPLLATRPIWAATTTSPSASQVTSALANAAGSGGSNLISAAFNEILIPAGDTLTDIVSATYNFILSDLIDLFSNPELKYSYGRSPPVYPSRMSLPQLMGSKYY